MDWEKKFSDIGAFWFHDGNPKRPYARLTSGKISNGFFNGGKVAENARLFGQACEALALKAGLVPMAYPEPRPYVIGAAMGAIPVAFRIAEAAGFNFAYAEKNGSGGFAFTRFSFPPATKFVMAEDTISTGGTLEHLEHAASLRSPGCTFFEVIPALCNRSSGTSWKDMKIVPLIERPMPMWNEGENPFTPDGRELVEPVRPKENWDALTREY